VVADRDVEARDDFGRLLAYVRRADDDVLVNEVLVREGFARTLFFAPNLALESTLRAAERSARADRRGLWSACP
jgi:micrococcal nuclease